MKEDCVIINETKCAPESMSNKIIFKVAEEIKWEDEDWGDICASEGNLLEVIKQLPDGSLLVKNMQTGLVFNILTRDLINLELNSESSQWSDKP